MIRAVDLVTAGSWAIREECLETIVSIATRQNESIEAVVAKLGRPLENTRETTVRDGVATVPVTGPIFRRANLFTQVSGATSIEELAADFQRVMDDPTVKAVILEVDSPGGEVKGVAELAQMIYDARSKKPLAAYVDGDACSAAYWLASSCPKVVCSPTSLLGSIGVVVAFRKNDRDDRVEIVSSQSPNKRLDPATKAGREAVQATLDDTAAVFIAAVARNRGVSEETVLSDFGQGGVMVGATAVDAGLADRTGTYEALLAEMAERGRKASPRPYGATSARKGEEEGMSAWDRLKAAFTLAGFKVEDSGAEPEAGATPPSVPAAGDSAETVRLRAEIVALNREKAERAQSDAKARQEAVEGEVKAFVQQAVKDGKVLPAEAAGLTEDLLLVAQDDLAHPLASGSRLERHKGRVTARTPHVLTTELVSGKLPDGTDALATKQDTEKPGAEKPIDAKRRQELLSRTPLGQSVLAAEKERK